MAYSERTRLASKTSRPKNFRSGETYTVFKEDWNFPSDANKNGLTEEIGPSLSAFPQPSKKNLNQIQSSQAELDLTFMIEQD